MQPLHSQLPHRHRKLSATRAVARSSIPTPTARTWDPATPTLMVIRRTGITVTTAWTTAGATTIGICTDELGGQTGRLFHLDIVGASLRRVAPLLLALQLSFGLKIEFLVPAFRFTGLLPKLVGTADNFHFGGHRHWCSLETNPPGRATCRRALVRSFWGDRSSAQ